MNIILYTTNCPNCITLKKMLMEKNIKFCVIDDTDEIINFAKNNKMTTVPILSVDEVIMNFEQAKQWIIQQEVIC